MNVVMTFLSSSLSAVNEILFMQSQYFIGFILLYKFINVHNWLLNVNNNLLKRAVINTLN